MTFYPGANPDVDGSSVTAPLERQILARCRPQPDDTSTSSFGSSVITLQFNISIRISMWRTAGSGRHQRGANYLPTDLPNPPIYSKVNPADSPILLLALTSKTLRFARLEDLAGYGNGAKDLASHRGPAWISISGGQKPAVRIQANPTALASYGLSLEDVCALRWRQRTSIRLKAR